MSLYHRQSGFGLTESLIALVILSVGLLALNGVHTQFIRSLSEENNRSQALMLTSKRLDEFRMDAADKTFDASNGSEEEAYGTSLDQAWTVSGSNPATVTVTTSWGEDASDSVTLSALISELTPVTLSFQGQEVGSGGGSSSSPSNESPVATDDAADVTQNQSGSNNSVEINVKVNDSDAETANADLNVSQSKAPSDGELELENGIFTYTPDDGFVGVDTFTYLLGDGDGGVDSATVTITVLALSGSNSTTTEDNGTSSNSNNNTANSCSINSFYWMSSHPQNHARVDSAINWVTKDCADVRLQKCSVDGAGSTDTCTPVTDSGFTVASGATGTLGPTEVNSPGTDQTFCYAVFADNEISDNECIQYDDQGSGQYNYKTIIN